MICASETNSLLAALKRYRSEDGILRALRAAPTDEARWEALKDALVMNSGNGNALARVLLSHGVDQDLRSMDDGTDYSLLIYAVAYLPVKSLDMLLEFSPGVWNCDSESRTALHVASSEGDEVSVAALLDYCKEAAWLDARCSDGWTALDWAITKDSGECCALLIEAGAHYNPEEIHKKISNEGGSRKCWEQIQEAIQKRISTDQKQQLDQETCPLVIMRTQTRL